MALHMKWSSQETLSSSRTYGFVVILDIASDTSCSFIHSLIYFNSYLYMYLLGINYDPGFMQYDKDINNSLHLLRLVIVQ